MMLHRLYNTNIRRFPKISFAGMFGFDKKAYFEAEEGSEKAPVGRILKEAKSIFIFYI